jgi:cbb3-type cytochrome oxidase cytochrome c subunit
MMRRIGLALVSCAIVASAACAGRGREVFVVEGCVFCHRFRELGSGGLPDLSEVGSRRGAAWIRTQICDPAAHNPATRMPSFRHIGGFDQWSLVAFLRS